MITMEMLGKVRRMYLRDKLSLRYCQLAEPGRKLMLISELPSDQAGRRPNVFAQVTPSQAAKAWLRFVRFSVASTL